MNQFSDTELNSFAFAIFFYIVVTIYIWYI